MQARGDGGGEKEAIELHALSNSRSFCGLVQKLITASLRAATISALTIDQKCHLD